MRIVFMGTPEFAAASLEQLLTTRHKVVGVFTQPDKPKGRGYKLVPPPVKELALAHQIPVFQPQKMRDGQALEILQQLQPDMIGIGPYVPHADTPFAGQPTGDLALTLRLVSLLRLLFPYALIPATTALGTIHPQGRERGLQAGANVVMPNLSPVGVRELYTLYDNKICTGEEAAQCRGCLERRVLAAGYRIVTAVGDVKRSGNA